MTNVHKLDPRGLFREAYKIEGIQQEECRSIFMDWALFDDRDDAIGAMQTLLDHYGPDHPDHPMTLVLKEGVSGKAGLSDGRRRVGRRRSSI